MGSRKAKGNPLFRGVCSQRKEGGGMVKLIKNGGALGCALTHGFHEAVHYCLTSSGCSSERHTGNRGNGRHLTSTAFVTALWPL